MKSLSQKINESLNESSQKYFTDLRIGDTFYFGIMDGVDYVKSKSLECINLRTGKTRRILEKMPVNLTDLDKGKVLSSGNWIGYKVEDGIDQKIIDSINESFNEAKVSFDDVLAEFKANGFMLTKVAGSNNTYEFARKNYAKQKGTIEKYGNKTILTWGDDYKDDAIGNSEIMDMIADFVNENVDESLTYPTKIKIIKDLYLVANPEKATEHGAGYDWSVEKSSKNNGYLKHGEVYVFDHEYRPHSNVPVGLNFNDEKGKSGPEFTADELKTLIHSGAIKEISENVDESLNESSEDKKAYKESNSFDEFINNKKIGDYFLVDKKTNKIIASYTSGNIPKAGQDKFIDKNHQLISKSSAKDPAPYLDQKPLDYEKKENWVNEGIEDFGNVNESHIDIDAMEPNSKEVKAVLKKHNVKLKIITKEGQHGYPEVRLTGSRKNLENILADEEGWDDASLSKYIVESVNESKSEFIILKTPIKEENSDRECRLVLSRRRPTENISLSVQRKSDSNSDWSYTPGNASLQWIFDNERQFKSSNKWVIDGGSNWTMIVDHAKLFDELKKYADINEGINESKLSEKDLKPHKDYLIKKGKIEAYAEYKSSKDGKHYFDNSGEQIVIDDKDLGSQVTNEDVNESKKEFSFEVSIRYAKEANEILKDNRNLRFEQDGSNKFIFATKKDLEAAKEDLDMYEITNEINH